MLARPEVDEALELRLDALGVVRDRLGGLELALAGLARGVADEAGRAADEGDHLVPGHLEALEHHDGYEVSRLEAPRGRVEPAIDGHRLFERLFDLRVGEGLDKAAFLQLF